MSSTCSIIKNPDGQERARLYQGDCLEVMPTLGKVDMVLTDPPYGTTQNKWDSVIPLDAMWEQVRAVSNDNTPVVMTSAQPFTSALVMSNVRRFKYDWTWKKSAATGHLNAKKMPMRNHEDVLVFYSKLPTYNPQGLVPFGKKVRRGHNGGCYGDSGRENFQEVTGYPRTVLEVASEGKTVHPTQKPVALMEYLIKTYTNEGDTVLDFTMGSGTTGVACANTNRKFVGIELDENYFQVAKDRIEQAFNILGAGDSDAQQSFDLGLEDSSQC